MWKMGRKNISLDKNDFNIQVIKKEEGTVSIIFCPVLKQFFKISWENENVALICTRIAEN